MIAAWYPESFLSVDLETTSPDPETCRIVTAHAVECGAAGSRVIGAWLSNPEIPIPPEATAVHGITDDIAATGWTPVEVLSALVDLIEWARALGVPLVIMNASFDLTVIVSECARVGIPPPVAGPVIDPHIIDKGLNPFRKGGRKLLDLAKAYGVKVGEAHNAADDALMAARIVWAIGHKDNRVALLSLEELQIWQRAAHEKWAVEYRGYLRKESRPAEVELGWPLRGGRAHVLVEDDPRDYGFQGAA